MSFETDDVDSAAASNLEFSGGYSFASDARPTRAVSFANSSVDGGDVPNTSFFRSDSSPAMKATRPAAQKSQNSVTRAIAWAAETSVPATSEAGTPRSLFMPKKMKAKVKGQEIEQENAQSAEVAQQLENVQDDVHRVIQLGSVNSTKSDGSGGQLPEDLSEAVDLVNQFRDDLNERQLQLVYTSEIGRQLVTRYKVRGDELTRQMDAADAAEEELRKQQDYNIVLNNELQQLKQENRQFRTRLLYLEKTDEDCRRLQQEVDEKSDVIASLNAAQVDEENTNWEASELSNRWRAVARDMAKIRHDKEALEQSKQDMTVEMEKKVTEKVKEKLGKERRLKNLALQALKRATEERLKQQIQAHVQERDNLQISVNKLTETMIQKEEEATAMADKNKSLEQELENKSDELIESNRQLQQEASKQLESQLSELNKKLSESRDETKRSKNETQEAHKLNDESNQQLLKEQLSNEQLQMQITRITKGSTEEQEQLKHQLESAVQREQDLSSQCTALQDTTSSLEARLSDQGRKLNQEISQLKNDLVTQTEQGDHRQKATSILESDCDALEKKVKLLEEEKINIKQLMEKSSEAHSEAMQSTETRLREVTEKSTNDEMQVARVEEELESQKTIIKTLKQQIQDNESSLEALKSSLQEDASHKMESLENRLNDTTQDLEQAKQHIAREIEKFSEAEESHSKLATKWKVIIEDQRVQLESATQSARHDAQTELKISEERVDDQKNQISVLKNEIDIATDENKVLKETLTTAQADHKIALAENNNNIISGNQISVLQDQLSSLKEDSINTEERLTSTIEKLQSENQKLSTSLNQAAATYKDTLDGAATGFTTQLGDLKLEYQKVISDLRDSEQQLRRQLSDQKESSATRQGELSVLQIEQTRLVGQANLDKKELQKKLEDTIIEFDKQLNELTTVSDDAKLNEAKMEMLLTAAQTELSQLRTFRDADAARHTREIESLEQEHSKTLSKQKKLQDNLLQSKQQSEQVQENIQTSKRETDKVQSGLLSEIKTLKGVISNLDKDVKASEDRCKHWQDQHHQTMSSLNAQKAENEHQQDLFNSIKQKLQISEEDITKLEEIRKTQHAELTQLESKCITIEGYLDDEKDRCASLQKRLAKHDDAHCHTIKNLETAVEYGSVQRNREQQQYQQRISAQEADVQNLISDNTNELNRLRDEIKELSLENTQLSSRVNSQQSELRTLKNIGNNNNSSVRRIREDLTTSKDDLQEAINDNKKLQQDLATAREKIKKAELEKEEIFSDKNRLITNFEMKIEAMQLQESNSRLEYESQLKSLNAKIKILTDAKDQQVHQRRSLEQEMGNELVIQTNKTAAQQQQVEITKRLNRDLESTIHNKDLHVQDVSRSVARERAKVSELEQTITRHKKQEVDLKNEISDLIAAQHAVVTSTEDAKKAMEFTIDQANEEHASIRREVSRYKQMSSNSDVRNDELHEQVQILTKQLHEARNKTEEIEWSREALSNDSDNKQSLLSSVQQQLDESQLLQSEQERKYNKLEFELQDLHGLVSVMKRKETSLVADLETREAELSKGDDIILQLERERLSLQQQLADTEREFLDSREELINKTESAETFSRKLRGNVKEMNELEIRLQQYDEQLHDKERALSAVEVSSNSKELELITLRGELSAAQQDVERYKHQLCEAVTTRDGAEVKSTSVEKQLHDAREEAIAQRRENNRLQQETDKEKMIRKTDLQQKELHISRLQREVETLQVSLENEQLKEGDVIRLKKDLERERTKSHQAALQADRATAEQRRLRSDVEQVTESTARTLEATVTRAALDELDQKVKLKLSEDTLKRATSSAQRTSEIASELEDRYRKASAELGASRERVVDLENQLSKYQFSCDDLQRRATDSEKELSQKLKLLQDVKIHNYELQGRLEEQSKMCQVAEHEVLLERSEKNMSIQRVRLNRVDHNIESDLLRQELRHKDKILTEHEIKADVHMKNCSLPRTTYSSNVPNATSMDAIRSLKVIERSVDNRSPSQSPSHHQNQNNPINDELVVSHQKLQHATAILRSLPEQNIPSMNPIHVSEDSSTRENSSVSISKGDLDTPLSNSFVSFPEKATDINSDKSKIRTMTSMGSELSKSKAATDINLNDSVPSIFSDRKEDQLNTATDVHAVAASLHKAMQGLGTDEDRLYSELSKLQTATDWADVRSEFRENFSKFHGGDLRKAIEEELTARELTHARSLLRKKGIRWDSDFDETSIRSKSSTSH